MALVQYNECDYFCAIYVTGCAEIQTESCWDWEEGGSGNGTSDFEIILGVRCVL